MMQSVADLAGLNTLGLRAEARDVVLVSDPEDLQRLLRSSPRDDRRGPQIAGELSNTVLGETVDAGLVLFRGGRVVDVSRDDEWSVVRVQGSCSLDDVVARLCELDIPGFELLSGIPGTIGAAVV